MVREPEFDDETRAHELAVTYIRDTTCPTCGNNLLLSTDPDHKNDWCVDQDTRCYACADRDTLIRDAREHFKDEKPQPAKHMFMDGRDFQVGPAGLFLPTAKEARR